MGRYRARGSGPVYPSPIHCGDIYIDTVYPFGNGPWTLMTPCNWPYVNTNRIADAWEETCLDELHPGPPYLTGGPFDHWKSTTSWPTTHERTLFSSLYKYEGFFISSINPKSYLPFDGSIEDAKASNWGDRSDLGATAWNKFRPGKPKADLGVFIGEMKDVPRMLRSTAKSFATIWRKMKGSPTGFGPKKVADQWLNTQFGWRPFINDLRKFFRSAVAYNEIVSQLRRDNGQWVKRGGTVDESSESDTPFESEGSTMFVAPSLPTHFYEGSSPRCSTRVVTELKSHTWFEGRFRYWVPYFDGNSLASRIRTFAYVYGLNPSPSLVWELIPWSWLVDWCSNLGDVIDNISAIALDDAAAKYAFLMTTTLATSKVVSTVNLKGGAIEASEEATLERKLRTHASPFGFGLTSDDFSLRQFSILAALGLSRF